jgi:glycerophosphoryl diester phosphodiesterase
VTPPRTGYAYLDAVLAQPTSVLAFAHRGGAYHPEIEGLENTLAAFEHAVALGYDYLETDVHVTRDGVLLAFHDAVLDRVTDRKGEIVRLTYDEVRTAVIGGRAEIPTLPMLFDAFPETRFNIDIKSDGAVSSLADFLNAREAWDRVLVGSFSRRRLQRFRRLVRQPVPTSATPVEVVLFRFLPNARLANLLTPDFAALQIPHRQGPLLVTSRGLIRRAHAAGKHVHVWTIDDPGEMQELLDLGVDGLFTDRTDLLKDVLIARGQWRGSGQGRGRRP